MYNISNGDSKWAKAVTTVLNATATVFFDNGVMSEVSCETSSADRCTTDMHFMKGITARDLARTARSAPFTAGTLLPLLQTSAKAAASKACNDANALCSSRWDVESDVRDVGSQFSVLEVVQANLAPVSGLSSGGGSTPGNGTKPSSSSSGAAPKPTNAGGSLKLGVRSACTLAYSLLLLGTAGFALGLF